jgi:phosphatidylglycerophosphate synthase
MNRIHDSMTGRAERRVLDWLCVRMPGWVSPDMMTALGLIGAFLSFLGYWFSRTGEAWLWLAIVGLVVNWLGDSVDGSLARFRKSERPKYGFFLDHMTDTLAMALIAIGIGLSPYALLASGMAVLIAYYAMVILSMVTCIVTGNFRVSFGGIGPTEIRLLIVVCTFAGMLLPTPGLSLGGIWITIYDLLLIAISALLAFTCILQVFTTLRQLATVDVPKHMDGH